MVNQFLKFDLLEMVLILCKYYLPEIALEKSRYDRHGDCPPLLNHLQRDGTSILQVQSPWRSSIIKYMTISHRDCTLFFSRTISGDRFGRSSSFFGSVSYLVFWRSISAHFTHLKKYVHRNHVFKGKGLINGMMYFRSYK